MGHPTKTALMAYAESLVDNQATVDAQLAAHVTSCKTCTREVEAVRQTLLVVGSVPEIEPTPEFTARLLMAASQQRKAPVTIRRRGVRVMAALSKGAAVAASLAVVASIAFNAALGEPQSEVSLAGTVVPAPIVSEPEVEMAVDPGKVVREIQTFAAAVSAHQRSLGVWEREQWRSVVALDAELQAAMEALEQNPGCVRASAVYQTSLQRKADIVRSLYLRGN